MKRKIDGQTIVFTFDDGLEPITFDAAKASAANRAYATMHGFSQRIGDNAAIARKDAKTSAVINVTEAMRRDAVAELVGHYESGAMEWTIDGGARQNPAIAKMAARLGISYEEAARRGVDQMLDELMGK
jgi:hypothetical protein